MKVKIVDQLADYVICIMAHFGLIADTYMYLVLVDSQLIETAVLVLPVHIVNNDCGCSFKVKHYV